MKTFYSILKSLLFIGLIVGEIFLKNNTERLILIFSMSTLGLDFIIWFGLLFAKKTGFFRVFIFKIFRNIATSAVGMIALLFFAFHVHWLANSIFEFNLRDPQSIYMTILYFSVMLFPFLLITVFFKKEVREVEDIDRKILFSSLSLLDITRKDECDLTDTEKRKLTSMRDKKDFKDWSDSETGFVQWQPIFMAIQKLGDIKEVVLFHTNETRYLDDAIKRDKTYQECNIESLLKNYFPHIIVSFHELNNPNGVQTTIDDINDVVKRKSKKYLNREMVFSITGGTAVVSGAMTTLSILDVRGIVYAHQQKLETINTPIDVFDFKELWEEIARKYE